MEGLYRLVGFGDDVYVATSRRYLTLSTVVLDGQGGALVVDPAWDEDELAGIPADLRALGLVAVAGLATHVHYDHVLWHPDLGTVPRWSSPWTAKAVVDHRQEVLRPLVGDLPDALLELAARLEPLPDRATAPPTYVVPWSGPELLCHQHDAHAPAHIAVELVAARVLLAGDMLSDAELPMPDDDDATLEPYLAGLDLLAPVVARVDLLVPGHGTPTYEPASRLDADRRYLDAVLSGRHVDDQRLGYPDMAELHEANLRRARGEPVRGEPG
jgi:glyoxylase-like metal-dependent hydrolase (beta-lactamase superfamily II)